MAVNKKTELLSIFLRASISCPTARSERFAPLPKPRDGVLRCQNSFTTALAARQPWRQKDGIKRLRETEVETYAGHSSISYSTARSGRFASLPKPRDGVLQ